MSIMQHRTMAANVALVIALVAGMASAVTITGNPAADGWYFGGHALQRGVYTSGSANYGFDIYTNVFQITAQSNLYMSAKSWLAGDTVVGAGGVFVGITAEQAGWSSISGNPVNRLLRDDVVAYGPRLQAKFGVATAAWSLSTESPANGNGSDSTNNGGVGALLIRSSSWFHATDPLLSQETDTTWAGNAGQIMELDKPNHIERLYPDGSRPNPDANVARLIWTYNPATGKPASFQILLNVSLLDRLYSDFPGLTPTQGNLVVVTVQDRTNTFTNGMVGTVPEPATLSLLVWASLALIRPGRTANDS